MTNQPCWLRDGAGRLVQGRVVSISATRAIIWLAGDLPLGNTYDVYFTHDFKVGRRGRLTSQQGDKAEIVFEGPAQIPPSNPETVQV